MINYVGQVQYDEDRELTIGFISLAVTGFVHESNFGEIGGERAQL